MIQDLKKTKLQHDIAALPDHIVGRAEYLKDYFDKNLYEVLDETVNPLIDTLTEEQGAQNIGASGFSVVPAGTVQSQLENLKDLIDNAQWGIPDSCSEEMLKDSAVTNAKLADSAVTEEKLSNEIQQHLSQVFYPAVFQATETGISLTVTAPPSDSYALRFLASADYQKGETLSINDEEYVLTASNGKSLPDAAWISGAVVLLMIDPQEKKAFFNGGGTDLSYITATADKILEGYIGADSEGEPVAGTNGMRIQVVTGQKVGSVVCPSSDVWNVQQIVYPYPDFEYDYFVGTAKSWTKYSSTSSSSTDAYSTSLICHDKAHKLILFKDDTTSFGEQDYVDAKTKPEYGTLYVSPEGSNFSESLRNYSARVTDDGIVSYHTTKYTYKVKWYSMIGVYIKLGD